MYRGRNSIRKIFSRFVVLLAVAAISFYQVFLSPLFSIVLGAKCRYPISCSTYAKEKIKRYGMVKGGSMAIVRLLSCQPFARIHLHD